MYSRLMMLVLFSCYAFISIAQDQAKILETEAEQYFVNKKYPEALNLYLKYQRIKPIDNDKRYKIGICFLNTNNTAEAGKYFEYVIDNSKKPNSEVYYYLARSFHADQQFEKAAKAYKQFLTITPRDDARRAAVKDDMKRCVNGFNIKSVSDQVIVENLGEQVNSNGDDFGPILSPNYKSKIYFSSARTGNIGGLRSDKGLKNEPYGHYKTDIYNSEVVNGQWRSPFPIGGLINTTLNDVILGFNSNGKVLYYKKGIDHYSGRSYVDTFGLDIPPVTPPQYEGPMITENGDNYPCFFNDTIMLFSSNRNGGFGGMDLYISLYTNGRWSIPENLGSEVNSAYDDVTPFLATDGRTLYFSSNRLQSIGGHDIFRTVFKDKDRVWSSPENMGIPINSPGDDMYFKLSKDGTQSFFNSSRVEGYGGQDLYIGYFSGAKIEQTTQSRPIVFSQVGSDQFNTNNNSSTASNNNSTDFTEEEIKVFDLEPLFYVKSDNVLTKENKDKLDELAKILIEFPRIKVELESHSDATGPPKFDLYFSAKRGDAVAEYLKEKGVSAANILTKGCGVNYPVAKDKSELGVNKAAQKLNKRISFRFYRTEGIPVKINVAAPPVKSYMASEVWETYNNTIKGLSYKVQVASMKQMYNGDVINDYPNATIEGSGQNDYYQYTIGLYKTYYSAEALRGELERNGITDAYVVPYVNGLRATLEDAKIYNNAFPDLQNYLIGIGEN